MKRKPTVVLDLVSGGSEFTTRETSPALRKLRQDQQAIRQHKRKQHTAGTTPLEEVFATINL